jgi:FkbM family methyltransferase
VSIAAQLTIARILRRWTRAHSSPRVRRLIRDHVRKLCIDRELPVGTRPGFTMCVSPRDYISHTIYFFGEYDPQMTAFLQAFLRPGLTTFDVGTERGWFTLLMGRCVGPGGEVHGFEAFPPTLAKVRANVVLNDMHWVRVNGMAVTDLRGTVRFQPPTDRVVNYVPFLRCCCGVGHVTCEAGPEIIEVPTTTVDEYAAMVPLRGLDLMKLDIEGSELRALKGATKVIERFRPVLLVEYNRLALRRAGTNWRELDRYLEDCAYDRFIFNQTQHPLDLDKCDDMPDEEAVVNVYAFPRQGTR